MKKTDEELMQAYQMGDAQAFEALYNRNASKVYGYLTKRLQRKELVDECFQKVFAKFHRFRNQYDSTYTVEQWLYVISKSTLVDHFRKESREIPLDAEVSVEEMNSTEKHHSKTLSDLPLESLSAQQKQVIQWRILDDVSYEEIAKRLNVSETNIRQIFSRAVKKLRSVFMQEGGKV